jgi:hypothetical protein
MIHTPNNRIQSWRSFPRENNIKKTKSQKAIAASSPYLSVKNLFKLDQGSLFKPKLSDSVWMRLT